MAVLIRSKLWTPPAPPPPGSQIDPSHPLARGLVTFIPLWLGASPPRDRWWGHGQRQGSATWGSSYQGRCLVVPSGGNGFLTTNNAGSSSINPALVNETAMSYAVFANITGVTGQYASFISARLNSGSTSADGLCSPAANHLGFFWSTQATYNWTGGSFSYNRWQVLGGSIRSAATAEMLTWSASNTSSTTSSSLPTGTTSPASGDNWFEVGCDANQATRIAYGRYVWAAVWNRWVTPSEYAWLNENPFAMFTPQSPRQRYWLVLPALPWVPSVIDPGRRQIPAEWGAKPRRGSVAAPPPGPQQLYPSWVPLNIEPTRRALPVYEMRVRRGSITFVVPPPRPSVPWVPSVIDPGRREIPVYWMKPRRGAYWSPAPIPQQFYPSWVPTVVAPSRRALPVYVLKARHGTFVGPPLAIPLGPGDWVPTVVTPRRRQIPAYFARLRRAKTWSPGAWPGGALQTWTANNTFAPALFFATEGNLGSIVPVVVP